MKTILRFVLVTLCVSFGSCDVPGTLVGISRLVSRAAPNCMNTYVPVCGDCKTLWKCQNSDILTTPRIDCKTIYPDRPHCSNGACRSEASSECLAQNSFRCTDAGYYPDPLNCSRYHLCGAPGAVGTAVATYECPSGFVYNTETTMCKPSTTCEAVVDCTADPNGYVLYPGDNRFFASCTPNEEPLMLRCPIYNVYKPSGFTCVFHCPREGRIPHPTDVMRYYDCYLSGSTYFYRESSCVDGYKFNQDVQQCIAAA